MTTAQLTDLQRQLRQMLPDEGIAAVLSALKKVLPEGTDPYNLVFQLETRLNATNKDRLRGILSQEQLELTYNRIAADLFDLINALQLADFQKPGSEGGPEAAKTGSILYRIPHTMEVEQEYRCVVRLAFDDEVIIRNIEITRDTVLKSVRVAEVMEVELLDPNGIPSFVIRKINSAEQFLEKHDYTEWIFFVKPLRTGELPLVLRIAVLEIIDEHERKKEIVLEEVIHVVADEPDPVDAAATDFKNAGYNLAAGAVGQETDRSAPPIPPPPATPPAPVSSVPVKGGGRRSGMVAAALLLLVVGIWAAGHFLNWWPGDPAPADLQTDQKHWHQAMSRNTREAYTLYLAQHPDGQYILVARQKLDSILQAEQQGPASGGVREGSAQDSPYLPGSHTGERDTFTTDESDLRAASQRPGKPTSKPSKPTPVKPKPTTPGATTTDANPPAVTVPEPPLKRRSGFEMVAVAGGNMTLGCENGGKDECPYSASIGNFSIGKYEVTQGDWKEIMGSNPSHFNYTRCDECPIEQVSWQEVQVFLRKASEKYKVRFRLPYEREWEYAARGGQKTKGLKYAGSNRSGEVGWYHDNSEETHRVGQKKPNELGLHDMSGNVWEWCMDTYQPYPGCKSRTTDDRIIRGGSFRNYANKGRTCNRNYMWPTDKNYSVGFRLVREN